MTVAVQKGLEHLTEALRGYGFDVVVYGEYQYPVDALVYMGEKMPMGESTPLTQSVSSANHAHHGVFMINARGKRRNRTDFESAHVYAPVLIRVSTS